MAFSGCPGTNYRSHQHVCIHRQDYFCCDRVRLFKVIFLFQVLQTQINESKRIPHLPLVCFIGMLVELKKTKCVFGNAFREASVFSVAHLTNDVRFSGLNKTKFKTTQIYCLAVLDVKSNMGLTGLKSRCQGCIPYGGLRGVCFLTFSSSQRQAAFIGLCSHPLFSKPAA